MHHNNTCQDVGGAIRQVSSSQCLKELYPSASLNLLRNTAISQMKENEVVIIKSIFAPGNVKTFRYLELQVRV